jgi:hypothetical protein
MWRRVRIATLLVILVIVAGETWSDRFRTRRWTDTLWIGVFPVNGDGGAESERYVTTLDRERFASIENFFLREAESFGLAIERPIRMELYPKVLVPPPRLDPGAGIPGRLWWNFRMRYYSWRIGSDTLADIRMFVLYHDPESTPAVPHSVGMQKGLFGIVYAYASREMEEANNIVIAHEVLHTLGATDKYDPATSLPLYPEGYAEPQAEPRYPQQFAEVMAGRTALASDQAEMPASLDEVVVGQRTAVEIGWVD